jgi:hypothetical protein
MISHPDVYQKLVASRHAQILHEVQQIRMLKHVRQRPTLVRRTMSCFGRVLIVLGYYMQRIGQQNDSALTLNVDTPTP